MKKEELPIGTRCYHAIFGWCKVTHPIVFDLNERTLVELEADEIKYYRAGEGYATFKRDESGAHALYTPISDLLKDDKEKLPANLALKKAALNPEIIFWKK